MGKVSRTVLTNGLAAIVILGFCTVIGISLWLYGNSRNVFGPTLLVSGQQGEVMTNIGSTLYLLDASGAIEQRADLSALGIPDVPLSDGLVLPDGRLLIGAAGGQQIYACELAELRCSPFLESSTAPASAYKLAWDDARQRLLVTDGERHRILSYDRNGHFIAASNGGSRGLAFPNTALLTPADELVVADTNHHRLVALDAGTLSVELWELPVTSGLGNFRRIWPTDFTRTADGHYWVILDDDLLQHGDVILFDPQHGPVRRLDLPADWDPVKLRRHGDAVLVAGFGSVDLLRVAADGGSIEPFGDPGFRDALAAVRDLRLANERWWNLWVWVCIAPLGLLAVLAAYLDYRHRHRPGQTGQQATAAPPLASTPDGIYWIRRNPAVVRQWEFLYHLRFLLPLLLIAPLAYLLAMGGPGQFADRVMVLLISLVPLFAWIAISLQIISGSRLGVTRDRLVLGSAYGKQQLAYPRQLVYGKRFISNGETTVITGTTKYSIFVTTDMQRYVQPQLKAARQLNGLQGYIYLLQAGDRYTWINTLAIAYLGGLMIYLEFAFPK